MRYQSGHVLYPRLSYCMYERLHGLPVSRCCCQTGEPLPMTATGGGSGGGGGASVVLPGSQPFTFASRDVMYKHRIWETLTWEAVSSTTGSAGASTNNNNNNSSSSSSAGAGVNTSSVGYAVEVEKPRANFDNIFSAALTVFQILSGEGGVARMRLCVCVLLLACVNVFGGREGRGLTIYMS